MASEIRKLTKLGADTRKIAALLQSKGRGRDTVLAHITPEEADLLKARGGRGSINPETGLPEFEDDAGDLPPVSAPEINYAQAGERDPSYYGAREPVFETPQPSADQTGMYGVAGQYFAPPAASAAPAAPVAGAPTPSPFGPSAEAAATDVMRQEQAAGAPGAAPGASIFDKLKGMAPSDDFLKRLGLAGVQAIPGIVQGRRAAQQAAGYKGEQQALAAPYQQLGRQLQTQAQAGTLTPQAQRSLQAARAQLAQGAEARGGVGAQQAATALEGLRQQLLQQQFDYGLKLSGIGDNIALGAIKTGMQADQYVNNLTSQFYNNLFRTLTGQPGATPAPAPAPAGG